MNEEVPIFTQTVHWTDKWEKFLTTPFKAITANLDVADGEFFIDSIKRLKQGQLQIEYLLKNQMSIT